MNAPARIGRYEVVVPLGRGGMAELFLGRLHGSADAVAIKRILPELADDRQFVEMFVAEGRIAARLDHPNICRVLELGEDRGDLFLAMEYLEGASWDAVARTVPAGLAKLRLAASVLAGAADGLHHAHALGIVHRDVSPQNLFVTTRGVCKVLDFGVAKLANEGPRTRSGVLKGKLPYMSPEQIRGESLDARADVWSLGVVLYETLAGESLFLRDSDYLIYKAIEDGVVPALAPRGYPAAIDRILARALARDRTQRYPDARAFATELVAIAGADDAAAVARVVRASTPATRDSAPTTDATVQLRGAPLPVRASAPAARSRRAWIATGCAIVVAIVAIAIAAARTARPPAVAAPVPAKPSVLELGNENGSIRFGPNGMTLTGADGRSFTLTGSAAP